MAQDIKRKEQVMKQVVEMLNNFATNWGPEKADKAFDLFESALERRGMNIEMCSEGSWAARGEDYRTLSNMVVGSLAKELGNDPAGERYRYGGGGSFEDEFRTALSKVGEPMVDLVTGEVKG
jgi:hypothetical protein